jgi:hypothetical protein
MMTVLILALGKLATRCQDLIVRVVLCLTKIIKLYSASSSLHCGLVVVTWPNGWCCLIFAV